MSIKIGDYWNGTYTFYNIFNIDGKLQSKKVSSRFDVIDIKDSDIPYCKILSIELRSDDEKGKHEVYMAIWNKKKNYIHFGEGLYLRDIDNKHINAGLDYTKSISFTKARLSKNNDMKFEYVSNAHEAYATKFKYYSSK